MAEMEFGVVEPNAQLAPQDWRTKIRESRYGTPIVLVFTAIIVICAAWFGSGLQDGENSLAQNKSADLAATAANSEVTDPLAILEVGKPAPDFTFVDSAGARVQLADYRGKPVWLVFATTWCHACRAEMPEVDAAAAEFAPKGVEVLTVFVGENKQTAQDYLEQTGYRLKSVPDHSSEIARQYGVVGIPAHYFIDPDGVLVDQRVGVLDRSTIGAKLADLLGGKTSAK